MRSLLKSKTTSERVQEAFRLGTPIDLAIERAVRKACGLKAKPVRGKKKAKRPA